MPNANENDPPPRDAGSDQVQPVGRRIEWTDLAPDVRDRATSAVARRCRLPREDAHDAVVDAMVRLMRLRPVVRNSEALLVAAALNIVWSRLGREKWLHGPQSTAREHPALEDTYDPAEPATEPSAAVEGIADRELIQRQTREVFRAISDLSAADQTLLHAYYFDGRSLKDMDLEQGENVGTNRDRLDRVRGRLRRAAARVRNDFGPSR